jgi:glycosyltransferase involved in cell wall biosynthesis
MATGPRILLNALFLDPGVSGGVETYLYHLAPALRRHRPDAALMVATTHRGARALRERGWPHEGIAVREFRCDEGQRARRQLAEQLALPLAAGRTGADLVHSLASVAPIVVRGAAHVITLHDVNFMHHRTFNPVTTWGMSQVIPRAGRRADELIAVTAAARDDICATLGLAPDRFTVIHHGMDHATPARPTGEAVLRARFGLGDDRIVLCVSAKRPHKNQEVLIRALALLEPGMRLVLAGHAEPYEQTLRAITGELGLSERVVFADWVDDADLEGLWAMAAVAAVPSLAEGFGLPLLEALAHGVPVVASDLPVLREIGADSPRFFDPRDPEAAADAIRDVLAAPPDAERERGWARRFSWEAAAEATWEVYKRALRARQSARSASA